jgi:hypothetical protein
VTGQPAYPGDLRAALGARPQCAAAQAMLADLIPDGPVARELR